MVRRNSDLRRALHSIPVRRTSTNLLQLSSLGFASSSSASAAAVAPLSRQRHSARARTAPLRVISFAVNRAERCRRAAATTGAQGLQRTWVDECKNVSKCRVFVKDRDRVVEPAMRTQVCWHRVTLSVQGIPMRMGSSAIGVEAAHIGRCMEIIGATHAIPAPHSPPLLAFSRPKARTSAQRRTTERVQMRACAPACSSAWCCLFRAVRRMPVEVEAQQRFPLERVSPRAAPEPMQRKQH